MDNFLETYNPAKLNQEEINNLNRPTTRSKTESVIYKLLTNKSPRPDSFTSEFYQTYKEELICILLKPFQKLKKGAHSQTHPVKPPTPRCQNQTQTLQKNERYRPVLL